LKTNVQEIYHKRGAEICTQKKQVFECCSKVFVNLLQYSCNNECAEEKKHMDENKG